MLNTRLNCTIYLSDGQPEHLPELFNDDAILTYFTFQLPGIHYDYLS